MPGSPGFDASFRHLITIWQDIELLINVIDIEILFHPAADAVFKILFYLMLDDKDDLTETRTVSVIERKINNGMAVIVNGHDLLQPAKAAAHSGSQNYKGRLFHLSSVLHCSATVIIE